MGNLQITEVITKAFGCSPQTDTKALFLKTTPTQLTELREVELVSTKSLYPYWLMLVVLEGCCMMPKEKGKQQPATKPSTSNGDLPTGYTRERVAQSLWKLPTSTWLHGPCHKMKPIPDSAQMATKVGLDRSRTWGKPTPTVLLKGCSNEMTLIDILVSLYV